MELKHIDIAKLCISAANMRARGKPDLSHILPSIRARGVLVPLIVRPTEEEEEDRFEIVAGKRRYHAALTVAAEGGEDEPLPCAIMEAGDDAAALEASLIENIARLDPDEVTLWETFTRLVREGRSPEDIALTFGLTELQVKRTLALGNLLPRIRGLYRKGDIDAATVRHLTLAPKARQREWLALLDDPDAHCPTGQQLKAWLFGGASIPVSAALFDVADYQGEIVSDLFGEDRYFADSGSFWTAQTAAVEAKAATYREAGW
jgi:ParB family chromosome partitioning protein